MESKTNNYNLIKPNENDYYDINKFNQNADIIDAELKKANDKINTHTSDTCHIKQEEREKWNASIETAKPYTYAELKTLKDNKQLAQGQAYLLTDYVTKYKQPQSDKMKVGQYDLDTATLEQIQQETEPLLLTAISANEFAKICYSLLFPQDIIEYNFDNNVCEDGSTPRNGFILRRNDTKRDIDVSGDWKHIKWARWRNPNRYNMISYEKQDSELREYYTFSDENGNYVSSNVYDVTIIGTPLQNIVFYAPDGVYRSRIIGCYNHTVISHKDRIQNLIMEFNHENTMEASERLFDNYFGIASYKCNVYNCRFENNYIGPDSDCVDFINGNICSNVLLSRNYGNKFDNCSHLTLCSGVYANSFKYMSFTLIQYIVYKDLSNLNLPQGGIITGNYYIKRTGIAATDVKVIQMP